MLFRDESIEEKKRLICSHLFDMSDNYSEYSGWDVVDNLPDNFISNILYLSNQPVFNYSYVDRDTNMFDSVIINTKVINLSEYTFKNDEYYMFYYMNYVSVRICVLDECETNKYFDNYIIEKRDKIISEILK